MITYLAGPIAGCTDSEANDWRTLAGELLDDQILNPMDRDYRGLEQGNEFQIVTDDLTEIKQSDAVLVYALRPSWGTCMEIVYAWFWGKKVVAVIGDTVPSPWLVCHSNARFRTVQEACEYINAL